MSLKIRLARPAPRAALLRIVVADSKSHARRYIESSAPTTRCCRAIQPSASSSRGPRQALAGSRQPTDRVLRFLDKAGMAKRDARSNPNKGQPGKKRWSARSKAGCCCREGQGRSRSRSFSCARACS